MKKKRKSRECLQICGEIKLFYELQIVFKRKISIISHELGPLLHFIHQQRYTEVFALLSK